jgi:IS30 family transposase
VEGAVQVGDDEPRRAGDRGPGHPALTLATDIPVYFAHAHSLWERGTNENTNGRPREHFPKGTDITGDIRYLNAVADEINGRPRAILQFRTPAEVFAELLLDDNPEDNLSSIASIG